jgi:hypothetical protein
VALMLTRTRGVVVVILLTWMGSEDDSRCASTQKYNQAEPAFVVKMGALAFYYYWTVAELGISLPVRHI